MAEIIPAVSSLHVYSTYVRFKIINFPHEDAKRAVLRKLGSTKYNP